MSIFDGLLVVQRSIPTDVLAGLVTGQFSLHGGVVRDGAGRIVRHLISTAPNAALNPFGMLGFVPPLVNVYQLNQLTNMTQALMQISQATMFLSGLNLAVSAVGFTALYAGLRGIKQDIDKLDQKVDWIKTFLETDRQAKLINALRQLSRLPPDLDDNAFAILHTSRYALGDAAMAYLGHWDASTCLQESMSYQHYFCTAFLAQARCSAELGMHDIALAEFREGMADWRQRAQQTAAENILGKKNRARFLDKRFAKDAPAAKIAGWMDFVFDDNKVRGYQWIDKLREEFDPPAMSLPWNTKKQRETVRNQISYLDNLASRDVVLKGHEAQLQFMAEHKIRPSVFAEEVERLQRVYGKNAVVILAPTARAQQPTKIAAAKLATTGGAAIDPETLIRHLADAHNESVRRGLSFFRLDWFVQTYLSSKGYDEELAYELINMLQKKGLIAVYQVDDPVSGKRQTAVRLNKTAK